MPSQNPISLFWDSVTISKLVFLEVEGMKAILVYCNSVRCTNILIIQTSPP